MTIAISGVGLITPGGSGFGALWQSLSQRRTEGLGPSESLEPSAVQLQRVTVELAPATNPRKSASALPRATVLALESARQAWHQAGIEQQEIDPERVGLFVASCCGLLDELSAFETDLADRNVAAAKPYVYQELTLAALAGHISIEHQIRGPTMPLSGTWRCSFQSLDLAVTSLLRGETDVALVVATESAGRALIRDTQRQSERGMLGVPPSQPVVASEASVAFVLQRSELPSTRTARQLALARPSNLEALARHALRGALPGVGSFEADSLLRNLLSVTTSVLGAHDPTAPVTDLRAALPKSIFAQLGWTAACAGPLALAAAVGALEAARLALGPLASSSPTRRTLSANSAQAALLRPPLDSNAGTSSGAKECTPVSET